jgi:uncharacterized membrane protein YadS
MGAARMTDLFRSILMGLGCLSIISFAGCSLLGASAIVAADRAIERASDNKEAEKGPWDL